MYVISSDSPLLADDETYLEHYGVKGMKWGVVRTPEQLRRARGTKPWESGTSKKNAKVSKRDLRKDIRAGDKILRDVDRSIASRRVARNEWALSAKYEGPNSEKTRALAAREKSIRSDLLDHYKNDPGITSYIRNRSGLTDLGVGKLFNDSDVERGTDFLRYVGPRTGLVITTSHNRGHVKDAKVNGSRVNATRFDNAELERMWSEKIRTTKSETETWLNGISEEARQVIEEELRRERN